MVPVLLLATLAAAPGAAGLGVMHVAITTSAGGAREEFIPALPYGLATGVGWAF